MKQVEEELGKQFVVELGKQFEGELGKQFEGEPFWCELCDNKAELDMTTPPHLQIIKMSITTSSVIATIARQQLHCTMCCTSILHL